MKCISIGEASQKLDELLHNAVTCGEGVILTHPDGNAVMVSQQEWENMKETLQILMDKKALTALLEGQKERAKGKKPKGKTIDQVFYDLKK